MIVNRPVPAARWLPLVFALATALNAPTVLAQAAISQAPETSFTVTRFEVTGENPLSPEATQEVLKPYLGEQHDLSGLEAARRALAVAIQHSGAGLFRVVVPPQDAEGTIRLSVARIAVTSVDVVGEKYFSEANIRASVPDLRQGQSPEMAAIERDLEQANDNPAKHTAVQFQEDASGEGIAAVLKVEDKSPWSLTVGANNTGTASQGGEARLQAYLQYANLFGLDQTVGVAYSLSPDDPDNVKQYGIYYKAPIYAINGFFSASHSYSTTTTGALGSGQTITGAGTVDGIAYTQLLAPLGAYKQSLAVGLDDKLFRSPTLGTVELTGGDVRSTPFSIDYVANDVTQWGTLGFNVELDHNIAAGSYSNPTAYSSNRFDATPDWNALRFGLNLGMPVYRGFALNVRAVGQYSNDALIQGEQFGIGGANSVRGAPERAVIGDSGLSASLELYTPDLGYNTRLLAFTDGGYVSRHDVVAGQPGHDQLQSVGVGLRWSYGQVAQFALDYGYLVRGSDYPSVPTGTSRIHANLLYTFN